MPIRISVFAKMPGVVVWAALSCGCAAIPSSDSASGPEPSRLSKAVPAGGLVRYTEEREPCADRNPYRNAYFGDLHVHTSYSYDARPLGVTTLPADAYRYARGEEILLPPHEEGGEPVPVRKVGPALDFAAVTDHAEFFGEHALCADASSEAYGSRSCEAIRSGGPTAILVLVRGLSRDVPTRSADICGDDGARCVEASRTYWERTREMAEAAYDRSSSCGFTTFVAYEHSATRDNNSYHRNVIFRNDRVPELPISTFEAPTDRQLFDLLSARCIEGATGCDVLSIPHSSNLSSGTLFTPAGDGSDSGQDETVAARQRNVLEPIMEIFQHKGSAECFNGLPGILGGPDELCDMEELRRYYRGLPAEGNPPPFCDEGETGMGASLNAGCVSRNDYYRSTLLTGLQIGRNLGANPYKFGVIGSTDTHLSISGDVQERGWRGHNVSETDLAERLTPSPVHPIGLYTNPGGLAGVWAVENSRDALFDALKRREVFGTTGPRIRPRFFGGWNYAEGDCATIAEAGYAGGVPMGGDLPARSSGGAPRFIVAAESDRRSSPLLRLQVIKGWIDKSDQAHYKVFDVAGDPDAAGSLDLDTGAWEGPGHASLCAVFEDPEFDPGQPSYYYMRAVEAPSLRWSWQQCLELSVDQRPAQCKNSAPKVVQELAWASPIWYQPDER
ncbi:MAG: DUF3604 domain-containing protein [Gammaproteobacteria bacterium]|nr:DUF3604 domain-containing protein [Gammaproteobacteria bacterium]